MVYERNREKKKNLLFDRIFGKSFQGLVDFLFYEEKGIFRGLESSGNLEDVGV